MNLGPPSRSCVSFRIGLAQWRSEKRFQELLLMFRKFDGIADEISLFNSETHAPLPLETIRERALILERRMAAAREAGFRSGVNILATIGHKGEDLAHSLNEPYTRMTYLDGDTCPGSFCPNDEGTRSYVRELYQVVAAAAPDYIWIDDDVRIMHHKPLPCGCFCENCLNIFEQECGVRYSRGSLRKAFNEGAIEEKLAVRRAWLQHNRNTMARLFTLVEETVHEVKPAMPLGFMTGERFIEGFDFDVWADTLAGPPKCDVMWRPGGGNYTEERLEGILEKAHEIGRQVVLLPPHVVSIQSEVENFTYQRLKKSAHATVLESACYVASGCTGAAFNVLSMYDEPLDEYEPLLGKIASGRPFLDALVNAFGRTPSAGVYSGWGKDSYAPRNLTSGDWFAPGPPNPGTTHNYELLATGFPAAYSIQHACVSALSGDSVAALSENDILRMLSDGVYMDGGALSRLNEMGFQELTGFSVEGIRHEDCIEQLTNHALNGAFAGRHRDGRQSFREKPAYMLQPVGEGAEPLARLVDYAYEETAPCCAGIFENRLGGRVYVAGYFPWTSLQNLSKSTQLKSVMRWLSKDTLPAYVSSFHRVALWTREPVKGKWAIALVNAYLDPAENVSLMVRSTEASLRVRDMQLNECEVPASGQDGPYREFILPTIGPWQMLLAQV